MSDIVERLRARHSDTWPVQVGLDDYYNPDGPEAADEIERLRAALSWIMAKAVTVRMLDEAGTCTDPVCNNVNRGLAKIIETARKALEET